MSKEVSKKAMPLRKATFTVETNKKGERIFHPVNKRASKWAKKVGKRTRLTLGDMQKIKEAGRVKLAVYNNGVLKSVRV